MSAALSERPHSERVALAVVDLLKDDDVVATWCQGRVYRLADPTLLPDRPRPFVTVAPDLASLPLRLGGASESQLRVLVGLFFDEPREELSATERGADAFLHHLWWILHRTAEARALKVAQFEHRPLVQASPTTADLTLAEEIAELPDGTPVVHRHPELQLTYTYVLRRDTGQPEGFPLASE